MMWLYGKVNIHNLKVLDITRVKNSKLNNISLKQPIIKLLISLSHYNLLFIIPQPLKSYLTFHSFQVSNMLIFLFFFLNTVINP